MPTVSAIITTHSRPHLLPRAVASARRAGTRVEVVVVDDGSTDSTAKVCQQIDGIKYVRLDRNQGTAGARNVGILASSSDFITFLDDDDLRLPGSLDRQLDVLRQHPNAGFVYGPIILGDDKCEPTGSIGPAERPTGDIFWAMLARPFMPCLSVVFRKSCLLRVGLLNASAVGYDDWDLWIRICELYPVVTCDEPVAIWRASTPSSGQGSSSPATLMEGFVKHHRRLLGLPRAAAAPPWQRREARRKLLDWTSDLLIWDASAWLPLGFKRHARRDVLSALRMHPAWALRPWTLSLLLQSFLPGFSGKED